jgi:hypothetical protein
LDRARRIAESYRTALLRVDPNACARLDANAIRVGQGWVVPQPATVDLDEPLDTYALAAYCYVEATTVDVWVGRGLRFKDTPDGRRFLLRDLLDFQRDQRLRRAASRKAP